MRLSRLDRSKPIVRLADDLGDAEVVELGPQAASGQRFIIDDPALSWPVPPTAAPAH